MCVKDQKWPCREIEKEEGKHNNGAPPSIYTHILQKDERVVLF